MSATKLTTLLEVDYGPVIDSPNARPDNVVSTLEPFLKGGYLEDREQFADELRKEKGQRPPGNLVSSALVDLNGNPAEIEIFHSDRNVPDAKEWMANLQVFAPLFIETALPVDFDIDPRWNLFAIYERQGDVTPDYFLMGYATVYNFYRHPDALRPRISQFVILPPFQSRGLAPHLLQGIYVYYRNIPLVHDLVVEESSAEFQRIRDLVDCRDAARLPCVTSGNFTVKSLKQFLVEALDKLRLSRNQSMRVFEILLWKDRRDLSPEQQEECGFAIKRRILYNIMADHKSRMEFFNELREKGLIQTMTNHLQYESYQMVNDLFSDLIDDYRSVIIRLNGR